MRAAALLWLALLAGCHEPSFDERFDKAEKQIREEASSIDQELGRREKERQEAEVLASAAAGQASGAAGGEAPAAPDRNSPGR